MRGPRYAIYAAPRPDEALWRFGSGIIGYDADSGRPQPALAPAGFVGDDWQALTAEPRRYGFHATLKAPFHLAEGRSEDALQQDVHAFCERHNSLPAFTLKLARLGNFFALVPAVENPGLQSLAAAVVEAFEPFRASLSADDVARRSPDMLPARERDYLLRYGYPYVFDAFRFHMTLTGRVKDELQDMVSKALAAAYDALPPESFRLADLVLFRQERRDGQFTILSRHALKR